MNRITREELKAKIDRGEGFKLVNCLEDWMFRAKRIPGSCAVPVTSGGSAGGLRSVVAATALPAGTQRTSG
ncbi:MAG: hypothetical protein JO070_04600 [Verrucomicrobia bacterium]|nr:hypothetical protein [Verrucomicrobiota bacterium]